MLCPFFEMPGDLDLDQFQDVCHQLFRELGPLQVQAWPELEVWLNDWSAEIPSPVLFAQIESFTLSEKELEKKMLDADFNTIYTIQDADLFTKFFLAAYRHEGFSAVFIPPDLKRYELIRLIQLGEKINYPQAKKKMGAGTWMLCIGCYSVCEEDDSVLFASHDPTMNTKIKKILQRIALRVQEIELQIEYPSTNR